MMILCFI